MHRLPFFVFILIFYSACQSGKSSQKDMEHQHTNELINSTSPYLLQHAHNPVDWHPWGDEAFEKARTEDKLVLVSIGYSACHWCHVMEHETFEDSAAAAFMNEHFVSIKVDREERPDVDQVYMTAVQLMKQQGGWPLNCFTLPDGKPIYGGTYFPKDSWMDLLKELVRVKAEEPEKMREYADRLTQGIQQADRIVAVADDTAFEFDTNTFVADWSVYWDKKKGGPNRAPKFPMPNNYEFLLHRAWQENDADAKQYVLTTLDNMARGGIYDQVGGGFARYSTDIDWKAPHFEKMLYDNGQLISLYSKAYKWTGKEEYERVIRQSIEFVFRELTSENNLFYSALDADSEGEEGKFYVWSEEELKTTLGKDWEWIKDYYNVNLKGKWEGHYILLRDNEDIDFAKKQAWSIEELHTNVDEVRSILLEKRSGRIRPGLDDKILTSWNGLMITGLIDAASALNEPSYAKQAEKSLTALIEAQMNSAGQLYHSHKEGKSTINAYLEDYAFTIQACLSMYQYGFEKKWLDKAKLMTEYAIDQFSDEATGLFYFTAENDSPLITRQMETTDNVIPASNSQMAKNLFVLGTLLGEDHFKKRAEQMILNILPEMTYGPSYSNWAQLALWMKYPVYEVAITGPDAISMNMDWHHNYLPNSFTLGAVSQSNLPLLEGKFFNETTIYVCRDKSCKLPVNTVEQAIGMLNE